jgi:uncharacterized pyridoxal phosphate-containing UPF0001 family protein
VAVTKALDADAVRAALALGLGDIGENYAQELLAKEALVSAEPPPRPRWHFLGVLQRNKVRSLAPVVHCWQGVARRSEGEAIAAAQPGARVLVQVDLTEAPQRNGVGPAEVAPLVSELRDLGLAVGGLMTVAPPEPTEASRAFDRVSALADALELRERSMGMSEDFELAVRSGSTMLRLGRVLFGARPLVAKGPA